MRPRRPSVPNRTTADRSGTAIRARCVVPIAVILIGAVTVLQVVTRDQQYEAPPTGLSMPGRQSVLVAQNAVGNEQERKESLHTTKKTELDLNPTTVISTDVPTPARTGVPTAVTTSAPTGVPTAVTTSAPKAVPATVVTPSPTGIFVNLPFDAAFIVNLPMRTVAVMANLATVGIHPIIVPAIHYLDLNRTQMLASGVLATNATAEIGEIAAFLSHKKAVKAFLESGYSTAIIFEDDIAAPDPGVIEDMTYIAKRLPKNWDMFYMFRCADDCSRQEIVEDDLNLVRCYNPRCTSAFALTQHAARTILAEISAGPITQSYDETLAAMINDEKLVTYCAAAPRLFSQDTQKVPSQIFAGALGPQAAQCYKLPENGEYKRMKPLE